MSTSFAQRIAAASLVASGGAQAALDSTMINKFQSASPTISRQELGSRIESYNRVSDAEDQYPAIQVNGNRTVIPGAKANMDNGKTSGFVDINDPKTRERLAQGDMATIQALKAQQMKQAGFQPAQAQDAKDVSSNGLQEAIRRKAAAGNPSIAGALASAMALSLAPEQRTAMPKKDGGTRFPLNYNEAQDAVNFMRNNPKIKVVTITGLRGETYNIVNEGDPVYGRNIVPIDEALKRNKKEVMEASAADDKSTGGNVATGESGFPKENQTRKPGGYNPNGIGGAAR